MFLQKIQPGIKYLILKSCPQCVNDKSMKADRKNKTYTCNTCGRTWRDERLRVGQRVIFTGVIRSTWHNDWEA